MEADKPQIVADPNLDAEKQQAQQTLISGLQSQAQMDTANILARFGTRMALSNSGLPPTAPAPAAAPAVTF